MQASWMEVPDCLDLRYGCGAGLPGDSNVLLISTDEKDEGYTPPSKLERAGPALQAEADSVGAASVSTHANVLNYCVRIHL